MIYGDIKTRSQRVRAGIFRRGRRGRITSYLLRGVTSYLIIDACGFSAWLFSGQPLPTEGYFLGKVTFELLKLII